MDRQKLIEDNLKLVYKIANKYRYLCCNTIDFDDLVSLGYIGLIKAAQSFDETKNFKFSTLAFICIKNSILREFVNKQYRINESNTVSMNTIFDDNIETQTMIKDYNSEKEFEDVENKIFINQIYNKCNNTEKKILKLLIDGYSISKISRTLHFHQDTVKSIIQKISKYTGDDNMKLDKTEVECPYCYGRLGDDINGKMHIKYCLDCGKWWETYTEEDE